MIEQDLEEVKELLMSKGIQTFFIAIKDPDSDKEAFIMDGSLPWIMGILELTKHEILFGGIEDE